MTTLSLVVAAGLVNWLVTTIIVESELGRPLRDLISSRRERAAGGDGSWLEAGLDRGAWRWLDYLVRCHLCVGVWVALAEVFWLGPLVGRGVAGVVFSALLVKAVGHLVLELRPQAWPRR